MNFGAALTFLKEGLRVARKGWNGKGMWLWQVDSWGGNIKSASPDPFVYLEASPFIAMKTTDDKLVPWLASQTDILAVDWEVVE
ncbi:hypothetical protein AZE41_12790 [Sporosarcina psychrophila]|nr:hypothetical protein AZE41_12790 [Sporosarcina psychrophila]